MPIDCDNLESECDAWLRDEWRGDEERMQWLVEEARSAARDLREFRRVIEAAPEAWGAFCPNRVWLQQWESSARLRAEADGGTVARVKVVPIDELEATCQSA